MRRDEALKVVESYLAHQPARKIVFDRDLFAEQLIFINSPAKRKGLLCGRRSGKSTAVGYYLIKTALEIPNSNGIFLGLTRVSAVKIIQPVLKDLIYRYKIDADWNAQTLTYTFSNNATISITGADQERLADRFRGTFYNLSVVDEAQSFGDLDYLVNSVLAPSAREVNGVIVLAGTPGLISDGLFYRVTTGVDKKWEYWHWDLTRNCYYKKWAGMDNWRELAVQELDVICEEESLTRASERFRREYLGEWVKDASTQVFKFDYARNTYTELPPVSFNWLLGVDFGMTDPCAIIVAGYSFEDQCLYITAEYKESGVAPGPFADIVKTYYDQYSPVAITADGGGIGAAFIAQIQLQHELPIELSEKKDKVPFIELLNDDLRAGRIKIARSATKLIDELTKLQWANADLKELRIKAEDHLADALLYTWRKSLHFKGVKPVKPEDIPEDVRLLQQEMERMHAERDKPWWNEY